MCKIYIEKGNGKHCAQRTRESEREMLNECIFYALRQRGWIWNYSRYHKLREEQKYRITKRFTAHSVRLLEALSLSLSLCSSFSLSLVFAVWNVLGVCVKKMINEMHKEPYQNARMPECQNDGDKRHKENFCLLAFAFMCMLVCVCLHSDEEYRSRS